MDWFEAWLLFKGSISEGIIGGFLRAIQKVYPPGNCLAGTLRSGHPGGTLSLRVADGFTAAPSHHGLAAASVLGGLVSSSGVSGQAIRRAEGSLWTGDPRGSVTCQTATGYTSTARTAGSTSSTVRSGTAATQIHAGVLSCPPSS
jgi:hypothetical protein